MKFRNTIEIKTAEDFEDVADDILSYWLEGFTVEKGLIREPNEEDIEAFGGDECVISFIYTHKGLKLYNRACERLKKFGEKLFPNEELDIISSRVLFP